MELAACLFELDLSCLVPWGSNESVMGMPLRVMGVLLWVPLRGMGCIGVATGCLEGVIRVSWGYLWCIIGTMWVSWKYLGSDTFGVSWG